MSVWMMLITIYYILGSKKIASSYIYELAVKYRIYIMYAKVAIKNSFRMQKILASSA